MAINQARILHAKVMHKRFSPKQNLFNYRVYYLMLPLAGLNNAPLRINRRGLISFHERDHGRRDGSPLLPWIYDILAAYGLTQAASDITLVTMPRILGYGFNPVSFWLCRDEHGALRAVLCEVHNTFGEAHSYLCAHPDHRPILPEEQLEAEKIFHVSPFIAREGSYRFQFALTSHRFHIAIDYLSPEGSPLLATTLSGTSEPLTRRSLHHAFWCTPLVTFKAITLIHWQALKLLARGIRYIPRPPQKPQHVSSSRNLTKNS